VFANVVAEGIVFPECSFIRACASPEQTLLARYLWYLLTEFDQTFTTKGLWGNDEHIKFWGQEVKVMVGSNMPQNALLGLVVVTCWQRHNS